MNDKVVLDSMQRDLLVLKRLGRDKDIFEKRWEMNSETLYKMRNHFSIIYDDGAIDYSNAFGFKILLNEEQPLGAVNLLVSVSEQSEET